MEDCFSYVNADPSQLNMVTYDFDFYQGNWLEEQVAVITQLPITVVSHGAYTHFSRQI